MSTNTNTKMRIKFTKLGDLRYISHLDLMQTISRAMRRAKVPIAFSQGYNPHHIMSLGSALALGLTSDAEYMDIELKEEMAGDKFIEEMVPHLPEGLKFLQAEMIPFKTKSLMAQINIAVYLINLKTDLEKEGLEATINEFYNQEKIIIDRIRTKRGKKKVRKVDLKALMRELKVIYLDGMPILKMTVQTGSRGNARPEEVMGALVEYAEGKIEEVPLTFVHRLGLYVEDDDKLLTPFEVARN